MQNLFLFLLTAFYTAPPEEEQKFLVCSELYTLDSYRVGVHLLVPRWERLLELVGAHILELGWRNSYCWVGDPI